MARGRSSRLSAWMNGELVGHWSQTSAGHALTYAESWVHSPSGRVLSLSLPFTPGNAPHRGDVVRHYFENLLPDRPEIRNRLRDRFRAASSGAFDLLAEVGRDCVGALQLLAEDEVPENLKTIRGEPLKDGDVEKALAIAGGVTFARQDEDDVRLSLAGAQEKSAFLWNEGGWQRPLGATPSTHIFKLPLGAIGGRSIPFEGSLENEWLCSRVLAAFGLPVAPTRIERFGDQRVLVVERFDRSLAIDGSWWRRLPVEDHCQAQGLSPDQKYEADGGPGIGAVMAILNGSEERDLDRSNFFKTQLIFWLLAAPDGHAKNFSLFLGPRGAYRATPLYDVLSAHPWIGDGVNQIPVQKLKMAMAVRGQNTHYHWNQIHRQHWDAEAKRNGLGSAGPLIDEILAQTPGVVDQVWGTLSADFPDFVASPLLGGLERAAARLKEMQGE